jgi:hypothetical protein
MRFLRATAGDPLRGLSAGHELASCQQAGEIEIARECFEL